MLRTLTLTLGIGTMAVALCMTGCSVRSAQPLAEESESLVDQQLIGAWRLQATDDEAYLHIGQPRIGRSIKGPLRCVTVHHGGNGKMSLPTSATVSTTIIGETKLASICFETDTGVRRYTFAKYVVNNDRLELYLLRIRPIVAAIERGDLEGEVVRGFPLRQAVLTSSSDELVNFIASASEAELFGTHTKYVFERMQPQLAANR